MLERQRPSPTPSWETEAGGWLPPPPLVGGGAGVPGHHQGQAGCLDSLEADTQPVGHRARPSATALTPFAHELGPLGTSYVPPPTNQSV